MVTAAISNPVAGFNQLVLVEKVSKAINTDWLDTDLDFLNIPTGLLMAIRVQIIIPTTATCFHCDPVICSRCSLRPLLLSVTMTMTP